MAPDLTSWLRWTPSLPCVLCLRSSPPGWGGLQRCHVSHDSLRATGFKHKEKPNKPARAARHACSQHMHTRFHGASRQGHYAPARRAGKQCCQYLQGVQTCIYSAATARLQRDASTMDRTATVPSDSTARRHTADRVQHNR
jgi:hypothetical protein